MLYQFSGLKLFIVLTTIYLSVRSFRIVRVREMCTRNLIVWHLNALLNERQDFNKDSYYNLFVVRVKENIVILIGLFELRIRKDRRIPDKYFERNTFRIQFLHVFKVNLRLKLGDIACKS